MWSSLVEASSTLEAMSSGVDGGEAPPDEIFGTTTVRHTAFQRVHEWRIRFSFKPQVLFLFIALDNKKSQANRNPMVPKSLIPVQQGVILHVSLYLFRTADA